MHEAKPGGGPKMAVSSLARSGTIKTPLIQLVATSSRTTLICVVPLFKKKTFSVKTSTTATTTRKEHSNRKAHTRPDMGRWSPADRLISGPER